MKARRPGCAASLAATSILALGLFVSAPNSASANIIYQYRSTCSEIDVAPFGGTTGLVLTCSELPSDQMSATVTVRDSYVPGTALSPGDVLSVVYRDPGYDVEVRTVCSPDGTCIDEFVPVHYPYVFDFGEVDAFGVIPASPGEPGFLIVKLAHGEDISLSIDPKEGWFYTCCGLSVPFFHSAIGPSGGFFRVAEPSTVAMTVLGLLLLGRVTRRRYDNDGAKALLGVVDRSRCAPQATSPSNIGQRGTYLVICPDDSVHARLNACYLGVLVRAFEARRPLTSTAGAARIKLPPAERLLSRNLRSESDRLEVAESRRRPRMTSLPSFAR